jgi:hypothetical protein
VAGEIEAPKGSVSRLGFGIELVSCPFIARSVAEAGKEVGVKLAAEVISEWNGAA